MKKQTSSMNGCNCFYNNLEMLKMITKINYGNPHYRTNWSLVQFSSSYGKKSLLLWIKDLISGAVCWEQQETGTEQGK